MRITKFSTWSYVLIWSWVSTNGLVLLLTDQRLGLVVGSILNGRSITGGKKQRQCVSSLPRHAVEDLCCPIYLSGTSGTEKTPLSYSGFLACQEIWKLKINKLTFPHMNSQISEAQLLPTVHCFLIFILDSSTFRCLLSWRQKSSRALILCPKCHSSCSQISAPFHSERQSAWNWKWWEREPDIRRPVLKPRILKTSEGRKQYLGLRCIWILF